jgi:hypothetical protein
MKKIWGVKEENGEWGKGVNTLWKEGYFLYEGGGNLDMCGLLLDLYWRRMINKIFKSIF